MHSVYILISKLNHNFTLLQEETIMAFAGILKEEDIAAAVQACLGLLNNIIHIQTYTNQTNTSHRLIQQSLHT